MRATEFEFRYRFFIISLIFWIGFSCSWFDHQSVGATVASLLGLNSRLGLQLVFGFGALLVALGAAIRTWAAAYLQSDVVHDMDLHSERLVADGPYRYVRNPLYLGVLFLSAGMGFMASRSGWFVLVAGSALFYLRLALREEAALTATQGESYVVYKSTVPRTIPSLTPRLAASGRAAHWRQALAGETFMWAFAVATLLFAVTLQPRLTWEMTVLILFGYLVSQIMLRRKKKSSARQIATT